MIPLYRSEKYGLLKIMAFLAIFVLWHSSAFSVTTTYDGSGDLDDNKNWSTTKVPTAQDEAVFNSATFYSYVTGSIAFGDFVWNTNQSTTIFWIANGITRSLSLGGSSGSSAAIAAGGATGDLIVMGTNAKTNTLTFQQLLGSGTSELQIQLAANGNFNVVNAGATLEIDTVISGSASLNKTGNGTLTLENPNTLSGGLTLTSGTLNLNNASALGTGTFTINGGTINNTSGAAITLSTNNNQTWNGNFTFTGSKDLNLGNGNIAMNGNRSVTVNAGNLTIGGSISGSGGLTKSGNGTLILDGNNKYTGATRITSGTLVADIQKALESTKSITVDGGSFLITASNSINDNAAISLGGGKLALKGPNISERVGVLTLTANSVIDVGALTGNSTLTFDNSFLIAGWAQGSRLSIWNWSQTSTNSPSIYFGSNSTGLSTTQLSQISFYSDFGSTLMGNAFIDGYGEIGVAGGVPEPKTIITALLLLVALGSGVLRKSCFSG